jgi:transposase
LDQLKKLIFGAKQERFVSAQSPEQMALPLEDQVVQTDAEPTKETITYQRRKKKHPGRTALPDNIPTEEITLEPEVDTTTMKRIGEDITETIDYRPGVLLKRRYIRPKYVRKEEQEQVDQPTVVIAPMPERPIAKGIAEAGLLAHLMVAKYVDHLPFYRQIQQFQRQHGWEIHKATINDWFAACCSLLEPLYDALEQEVMQTDYLQADESPIKVLDSVKKGKAHQGYMWVYRNPVNGLVLFDYRKGRGMRGPEERLADFQGHLQCDGYRGYKALVRKRNGAITLVSCLAHIRRKFYDAREHHPELAKHALKLIQQLYALERIYREANLNSDQRQQRRQQEARPIIENLITWVRTEQANNLSKGPIGKALLYAKNELPNLLDYLEDGRIEIDNNLIENAIRPLALGRKNYMFAGSHQGAQRAAMLYALFGTCKAMEVTPWAWLKDVLQRIPEHPVNRIQELLPNHWSTTNQTIKV